VNTSFALALLSALHHVPNPRGPRMQNFPYGPLPENLRSLAPGVATPMRPPPEPVLKDRYHNRPGDDVPLAVGQLRRDPQYRGRDEWHNGSGLGVCRVVSLEGKKARVQPIGRRSAYYSTTVRVDRLARWPLVVKESP
jgi:hypothetical protein